MFHGQTVMITGASRGIGRSIALAFAKNGACIAGIYSGNEEAAKETLSFFKDPSMHKMYPCDVSNEEAVQKTIKEIINDFGDLHILINNAGITRDNLLLSMKTQDLNDVIDVNLKSAFYTAKHAGKIFIKNRFGRIINISSISALDGNPGQTNYAASKAGLIGFTKSAAKELAPRNITVNAIAPGFIETQMTDFLTKTQRQNLQEKIPCKRLGTGDDVAAACLFLASQEASYITGQTLRVDGGLVL